MEYRRLQRSKGGSFLLSLPKEWVLKNGLQGGSVIQLIEGEGGALTIRLGEEAEPERGATAVIRDPKGLERQIRACYLMGADTIVVDLGMRMTPATREEIRAAIHKLIGLEIVEETSSGMTIQCLLQPSSMPVKSTLRRAYTLAANMHKEAEQALINGDLELAESVSRRDDEVDRLYFLLVRQLRLALRNAPIAEKIGVKPAECLELRMAAKYIENIADYSEAVATSVGKIDRRELDRETLDALSSLSALAYSLHEEAAQALFKQDIEITERVMARGKDLPEKLLAVNELLVDKQSRIAALLDSVALYFYQIGGHGVDMAELVSGTAL